MYGVKKCVVLSYTYLFDSLFLLSNIYNVWFFTFNLNIENKKKHLLVFIQLNKYVTLGDSFVLLFLLVNQLDISNILKMICKIYEYWYNNLKNKWFCKINLIFILPLKYFWFTFLTICYSNFYLI